jgi:hypothetical protein
MKRFFLFIILYTAAAINFAVVGQQLVIKTKKIQLLIEEWNIIHNARSLNSFQDIYDKKLVYYGEKMTRKKAISLKNEFFDSKPDYRQRIASDIDYTIHTSGTIKCEFLKEAWENGEWKPYLSYLLVGYSDGRFWITGESDHATDKSIGYLSEIGEAIDVEELTEKLASDSTSPESMVESPSRARANNGGVSVSKDFVTIPRDYLYILAGILFAGGLLILLAKNIRFKKKRKKPSFERPIETYQETRIKPQVYQTPPSSQLPKPVAKQNPLPQPANVPKTPVVVTETVESEPVQSEPEVVELYQGIENHLKQTAFRNYVIGLFQISNFKYIKPRANSVSPVYKEDEDPQPILEFQGESENGIESFGVQCLYREDTGSSELTVFSREHLDFNKQFVDEIDLYYLLGMGGAPDKPHGLYLIPAKQLTSITISKDVLKTFRKSGLFLYYKGKLR